MTTPSLNPAHELARLKRTIARAALCIMENPYDAISDVIWLSEDFAAPTLFEHLVAELDFPIEGTHDEQRAALGRYLAGEAAQ